MPRPAAAARSDRPRRRRRRRPTSRGRAAGCACSFPPTRGVRPDSVSFASRHRRDVLRDAPRHLSGRHLVAVCGTGSVTSWPPRSRPSARRWSARPPTPRARQLIEYSRTHVRAAVRDRRNARRRRPRCQRPGRCSARRCGGSTTSSTSATTPDRRAERRPARAPPTTRRGERLERLARRRIDIARAAATAGDSLSRWRCSSPPTRHGERVRRRVPPLRRSATRGSLPPAS